MAEQTTSSIVVEAPPTAVMAVIADFASYPAWAKGVKVADVESTGADGRADEVHFVLDVAPIKDDYTLAYTWDGDQEVTWTLARGNMLRALDGAYVLRDLGGRTEVTYRLALDLTIPLIGMLKRRGEKILIETALRGLKTRVESVS
jgi:ribosome-associated toxin RatA of RatAB toxin-antitoxin module